MLSNAQVAAIKATIFVLALIPLARLVAGVFWYPESLGPNPAEFITRSTGDWTLRFLLFTLAVTPLRKITDWNWLLRLRRMLGLYAFFYGTVHFLSFIAFDHVFDVGEIAKDIVKRPFITLGFVAFMLMVPLAITSTNAMVRRLGAKRWMALHRAVYPLAIVGVTHFWLMVKRDITEPAIYALILAALLGFRMVNAKRGRRRSGAAQARVT